MSNPWKQLRSLLPQDPTQVGESLGPNGDGTTYVDLTGGGRVKVAGDGYANGTPVFVKGGRILSQAPSLTAIEIQV